MLHLNIDTIILLLSILTGFISVIKWPSRKNSFQFFLPYFLLLIFVAEMYGEYHRKKGENNTPVFNLLSIIEFSYFLYFFQEVITGSKISRIIKMLRLAIPAICLINIFLFQGFYHFHTITYSLGSALMVILGGTYIYQMFRDSEKLNLLKEPSFWVCIGITFFFTCSVSLIGAFNYVAVLPDFLKHNLQTILRSVNAFFYTIFMISFVCRISTLKSSSSS